MDVAALTEQLAEIPSHRGEDRDESAAGDAVESWLRDHTDAAVERDDHGNVFARTGTDGPSLAFVGHHDVVPPDDSQTDDGGAYVIERRAAERASGSETTREAEPRLYGRGTADMKGSLAAAMLAFRAAETPTEGELVFASFVGEERGGVGCQAAIADGFAPDHAVVVEGSTGYSGPEVTDVAVAHKGRRGSTILAEGTAAHASEVEAGENAIYRASDAVDLVRGIEFPSTTVLGHGMQGRVAVTEIDGGSAWNVIPERCEATVDERTVPGERAPLSRVEAIDGVTWRVDQDLPPMACDDAGFADAVLDAATAEQDATPEHVVKPHATDAGWLAAEGTECVIVGAAEPGEAHTADESVSIPVLERCQRIYQTVAESWLA